MAPTIVLWKGTPVLAVGSPGGSRIISYVLSTIIAYIDWQMDVQAAVSRPHMVNRFGVFDLEEGRVSQGMAEALAGMGFETRVRGLNSGLHAISLEGIARRADPRREGLAYGE